MASLRAIAPMASPPDIDPPQPRKAKRSAGPFEELAAGGSLEEAGAELGAIGSLEEAGAELGVSGSLEEAGAELGAAGSLEEGG